MPLREVLLSLLDGAEVSPVQWAQQHREKEESLTADAYIQAYKLLWNMTISGNVCDVKHKLEQCTNRYLQIEIKFCYANKKWMNEMQKYPKVSEITVALSAKQEKNRRAELNLSKEVWDKLTELAITAKYNVR